MSRFSRSVRGRCGRISRRAFLGRMGAGIAGVLGTAPFFSRWWRRTQRLRQPNVLLIVTDEERHWSMTESLVDPALLGSESAPLPGTFLYSIPARLRLRRNGVRFNNYYTASAPCTPSRAGLYTGHHCPDTQVVDNMDFGYQESLNPEIPTTADVLTDLGYYCAYKGKVHLTKDEDLSSADDMLERYGFHDWEGPSRLGDIEGPLAGATMDDSIARNAAQWLLTTGRFQNHRGRPWLLAVNFINPHDVMLVDIDGDEETQLHQGPSSGEKKDYPGANAFPLANVPSRFPYYYWWNPSKPPNFYGVDDYTENTAGPRPQAIDEFASQLSAVFGNIPFDDDETCTITVYQNNADPQGSTREITVPLWQAYINYYLNCIIDNDIRVARVLSALDRSRMTDATVVIMTADHGEFATSHFGMSRYYDAAGTPEYDDPGAGPPQPLPLRQKGPFAYQENNNVPFIVASLSRRRGSLADRAVPHRNIDVPALASSVDLLPTLITWAGQGRWWYTRHFGPVAYEQGLLPRLPGVSLASVIMRPREFNRPRWSDGFQGRECVMFTSDAPSTADADFSYLAVWGQCQGASMDTTKRSILRGIYDGRHKYVRYFSPEEYHLNDAAHAGDSYEELIGSGANGQDIQLFDRQQDPHETSNIAATSNLVSRLDTVLFRTMTWELRNVGETPVPVQTVLDGDVDACAWREPYGDEQ